MALSFVPIAARAQGPALEWSGFYVGAHAGAQSARIDYNEPPTTEFAMNPSVRGFSGGALAGYDHRFDRFVLGVEGDVGRATAGFEPGVTAANDYTKLDLGWNTRLRVRGGAAAGNALVFAAVGFTAIRVTVDDTDPDFGDGEATHTGWTAGGGLEYAVGSRVRLRGEYLYDSFGQKEYSIAAPPGEFFPAYPVTVAATSHTARAAVVFRF
jgi:outer membrane immunogenic protein